MIIVDTNAVSDFWRKVPQVMAHFENAQTVYVPSVVIGELYYMVSILRVRLRIWRGSTHFRCAIPSSGQKAILSFYTAMSSTVSSNAVLPFPITMHGSLLLHCNTTYLSCHVTNISLTSMKSR